MLNVSAKCIAFAFTHIHTSWSFGLFLCGVSKINSGLPNEEHIWAVSLLHKHSSSTYYKPVIALNTWQIANLIATTILDWWTPDMKQMACSNRVIKSNLMEGLFLKVNVIKGIQQGTHNSCQKGTKRKQILEQAEIAVEYRPGTRDLRRGRQPLPACVERAGRGNDWASTSWLRATSWWWLLLVKLPERREQ